MENSNLLGGERRDPIFNEPILVLLDADVINPYQPGHRFDDLAANRLQGRKICGVG